MVVTVIASVLALGLVFAATLELITDILPSAPALVFAAIPHVNAGIALVALTAMTLGYREIRAGRIAQHRRWMLIALAAFATFLLLYLYNVGVTGPHPFPGPDSVYRTVYLPILIIHMVLAVICIPLLFYISILALTRAPGAVAATRHPTVARPTLALWVTTFVLGIAIYAMLYLVY